MSDLKNERGAYTGGNGRGSPPQPDADRRSHPQDQLALSASELASQLGISRAHVWKLASLGRLPAPVRLGRSVRWDKGTILAWLAAGAPAQELWERMQAAEKVSR